MYKYVCVYILSPFKKEFLSLNPNEELNENTTQSTYYISKANYFYCSVVLNSLSTLYHGNRQFPLA